MAPLVQSLAGMRWQDILDILLNSYILFRFYVLFRGTNVIRMLMAISMLWIFERIALSLGLIVSSWAIQGIIATATLIVIIVFRNEISSVFQVRSLKTFFWGIPGRRNQTPVEIIAEGVFELAGRGLGALIVLPLKKDIDEVVHGGVLWQGTLSREMLLSIFWHGTPVHDGAVVIQGNQIVKAAAILPLSKNSGLPSHFGTRHRAAAGLAEKTDALIIVVSEERGEVTVFKDNAIISIKDDIALRQVLRDHTGAVTGAQGVGKQKIELSIAATICVVSIAGIWFSFARGFETLATLDVPVEFINRASDLEIYAASASSVKLQISGSGSLIRSVNPDQLKVKLNLANAVAGNNQIPVTRDGIVLPPGIELKQLEPQILEVMLDVPVQKKLPIQPDWIGKLPAGLIMQKAQTVPDTVKVVGGNQTIKDIRTIYTEKIPLDTLTTDGKMTINIVLLPSSLKLADQSQKQVEVIYTIAKRPPSTDGVER
ncbi:MAG: diadenylate cyclase [Pseudomonadota bacterium]